MSESKVFVHIQIETPKGLISSVQKIQGYNELKKEKEDVPFKMVLVIPTAFKGEQVLELDGKLVELDAHNVYFQINESSQDWVNEFVTTELPSESSFFKNAMIH